MEDTAEKEEVEEEIAEVIPYQYEITCYGADYDVDGLVKRLNEENIIIPDYQRAYVWNLSQASRFIESLLLGLPVPGIFLSKEFESQKLLVIDGQQRLKTLQFFKKGLFAPSDRKFALKNVQKEFEGATYENLSPENKRRLNDSIIHATIIKQDTPTEEAASSVYFIYERLNTSGTLLQPQEIRSAIYHGEFRELLRSLNENEKWRAIYGPKSRRIRDEELILRFLALYYNFDNYNEPMKDFLNKFMGKNRKLAKLKECDLKALFDRTINQAYDLFGKDVFRFRKYLTASVFDAVMIGLARRLEKGPMVKKEMALSAYQKLIEDVNFVKSALESTGSNKNVQTRVFLAIKAFADVE